MCAAPRVVLTGLLGVGLLAACGAPPPDPAAAVQATSRHMAGLRGFHFTLAASGATGSSMPVQRAQGDAHPPDLRSSVDLVEGGLLIELEVAAVKDQVYVKSVTGGWQRLSQEEVRQFFDVHSLFNPQSGLFAAMRDTSGLRREGQAKVSGHDTWLISGSLQASTVHALLPVASDSGTYAARYWIESPANLLWRAAIQGRMFQPDRDATITFDFSKHDQPVNVTPPPLG
jgi:lipoprotein LprG